MAIMEKALDAHGLGRVWDKLKSKIASMIAEAIAKLFSMELVWANASPGSAFANQAILVDLSNYDMVMIYCNAGTSENARMLPPVIARVGKGGKFISNVISNGTTLVRYFTSSSSQINFDSSSHASNLIPCCIYGIKNVKAA